MLVWGSFQLLAEDQYKPSGLFSQNQNSSQKSNKSKNPDKDQVEQQNQDQEIALKTEEKPTELTDKIEAKNENKADSVKPLVADENHDVVVLEECDLAEKFEKTVNADYRKASQYQPYKDNLVSTVTDGHLRVTNWPLEMPSFGWGPEPRGVDLRCYKDKEPKLNEMFDLQNDKTKEKICADYFLTVESCAKINNLKEYKYNNFDPTIERALTFDVGQVQYFFGSSTNNEETRNIQIQFNSLAPSTPSVTPEMEEKILVPNEEQAVQNNVDIQLSKSCADPVVSGVEKPNLEICKIVDRKSPNQTYSSLETGQYAQAYLGKRVGDERRIIVEYADAGTTVYRFYNFNTATKKFSWDSTISINYFGALTGLDASKCTKATTEFYSQNPVISEISCIELDAKIAEY